MGALSPWHIAIVVIIALVIFGPKKLPELGRSVGSGIRDFRKGMAGEDDAPKPVVEAPATPVVTTTTAQAAEAPVAAAAAPAEPAAAPAEAVAEQPADPAAPQS